ncbi:MAG: hypothetical protein KAV42_07960 [Candidatus Krumholzibacteria bacterium]|nr:hypothetical protein [Candidatus Krumholzibacteria bacterium]
MSNVKLVVLCLFLAFSFYSCSGDDGATGPVGPAGTDGADGNAEVIMYEFGTQTTSTGILNYTLNVTREVMDSSLILVYTNPDTEGETAWYPSPGLGAGAAYMTRWYTYQTSGSTYALTIRILVPDGTAGYTNSVTFVKVKVIIAPASEVIVAAEAGELDLNDHDAVVKYLKR